MTTVKPNPPSATSGLGRYKADAGLVSYGVGAFVITPVTDALSPGLMARYDRLGPKASDRAGQADDTPSELACRNVGDAESRRVRCR